jgi:hypothetical protein
MNTPTKSNNDRLRELVEGAGLTQPDALALFNRGLGPAAYAFESWRAFFVSPSKARFRPLNDGLLEHAEKVFRKLQK